MSWCSILNSARYGSSKKSSSVSPSTLRMCKRCLHIDYTLKLFLTHKHYKLLAISSPKQTIQIELSTSRFIINNNPRFNSMLYILSRTSLRVPKTKNITCDKEKISPGKKLNSLLLPRLSPPSLGVSLCKRACIRSPWLDASLVLSLGIRLAGELHNQHEDWDEASEDLKRGLVTGKLEMYAEVERASMVRFFWVWQIRQDAFIAKVKLIGVSQSRV